MDNRFTDLDGAMTQLGMYVERAKYVSDMATDEAACVKTDTECAGALRYCLERLQCASEIVGDYLFQIENALKVAAPLVDQLLAAERANRK